MNLCPKWHKTNTVNLQTVHLLLTQSVKMDDAITLMVSIMAKQRAVYCEMVQKCITNWEVVQHCIHNSEVASTGKLYTSRNGIRIGQLTIILQHWGWKSLINLYSWILLATAWHKLDTCLFSFFLIHFLVMPKEQIHKLCLSSTQFVEAEVITALVETLYW